MSNKEKEHFIDQLDRVGKGGTDRSGMGEEEREIAEVWDQLGELEGTSQRDEELVFRFQEKLEAYKEGFGREETNTVAASGESTSGGRLVSFFRYTAVAGVAAMLALCGYIALTQSKRSDQLEQQLAATQETLALALLEQPSAPKRLAGLAAATQVQQPSDRLRATMVRTFDSDTNLNVRLAAVSAIATLPKEQALAVLLERMEHEESPLVQAEILRQVVGLVDNGSNSQVLDQIQHMQLEPKLRTALETRQNKI